MIYQLDNGKIITTAAGKLYTGACPPPPNCCGDGWNGEPPWGPGGPPPWFDPSAPRGPEYGTGCPLPFQPQGEQIARCADVGTNAVCANCCCPFLCRMIDDPNPIDPNAPPGTYLIPTDECQIAGMTARMRWTFKSRSVRAGGETVEEQIFESNVTWSQRPNATPGDCCEWSGSATLTRIRTDPVSGTTTTVSQVTPQPFNCFASEPYPNGPFSGFFSCFGRQPPPPDILACGACEVDIVRAFFDCRRSAYYRLQRLNLGNGEFDEAESSGFKQFSAPGSGDRRNPKAYFTDTPECRGIIGGGGNLP
jgi:hypothetical protein